MRDINLTERKGCLGHTGQQMGLSSPHSVTTASRKFTPGCVSLALNQKFVFNSATFQLYLSRLDSLCLAKWIKSRGQGRQFLVR